MSLKPDSPLFYLDTLPGKDEEGVLSDEESRHVLASRRMAVGDTLYLTDGRGGLARVTIAEVQRKRRVIVRVADKTFHDRPGRVVHVAAAPPKGDRMTAMLDMLTQLGMTRYTPLKCEYSPAKVTEKTLIRWNRICLAACKQSRRLWLPELSKPESLRQLLETCSDACLIAAHPGAESVSWESLKPSREVVLIVGPEGGFSPAEMEAMWHAGVEWADLGENILRIETAAVAMLARAVSM